MTIKFDYSVVDKLEEMLSYRLPQTMKPVSGIWLRREDVHTVLRLIEQLREETVRLRAEIELVSK